MGIEDSIMDDREETTNLLHVQRMDENRLPK